MNRNLLDTKHEPIAPSMTDFDVERIMARIAQTDGKEASRIFNEFNIELNRLISTVRSQVTDEHEIVECDRIKRILGFLPIEEKFLRMKEKVWHVRKHIINKDRDYFFNRDYGKMIKRDKNQAFIEAAIEIVKVHFDLLTPEEKEFYWRSAAKMLKLVLDFKRELGEYTNTPASS